MSNNNLTFGAALAILAVGGLVSREAWRNQTQPFLYLVPGSTFTVNRAPLLGIFPEGTVITYNPHIDIRNADGTCSAYVPSQADMLATDWFEFNASQAHEEN